MGDIGPTRQHYDVLPEPQLRVSDILDAVRAQAPPAESSRREAREDESVR